MLNEYVSASARIRALESRMLNAKDIERMLNSRDAKEAFDVLQDTDYADHAGEVGFSEYEAVLSDSLLNAKNNLLMSCPEWWVLDLISVWFDYYNIKLWLKAYLKEVNFEEILPSLSAIWSIDFKSLRDYCIEWKILSQDMADLRTRIIKDYTEKWDIQRVDLICDSQMLKVSLKKAREIWSELIIDFYKNKIDMINVLSYLRLQDDYNESYFIEWWNMYKSVFSSKNSEEVLSMIKSKLDIDIEIRDDQALAWLTTMLDERIYSNLAESKYEAYWENVVFNYFWSKYRSNEKVRTIMVWKINDFPKEEIESIL